MKNVARTWTYETACALGIEEEIDPNLPWNQYFEWFGPRYRLEVVDNNMDDLNVKEGSLDVVRLVLLVLLSIKHLTLLYKGLQRWNSCSNWLVHRLCRCKMYRGRPLANTLDLAETKKKEEMNWTNNLLVSNFYVKRKYTLTLKYIQNMQDMYTIYKIPTLRLKIQKVPIPGTLMNHQAVKTTGDVVLIVHPPPPG